MKYRKKPVVIEAYQMTYANWGRCEDWPEWLHEAWSSSGVGSMDCPAGTLFIHTLNGVVDVPWGEWIVKGVHGELYPCKPDIFVKLYEEVT